MSKNTYIEGTQRVVFDGNVRVVKLDKHRYYKYVSGRGFKGVDFMVLDNSLGLVLIELKHYREKHNLPSKAKTAQTFYKKCEDSLHLIEIVNKYLSRKLIVKMYHWSNHFRFLLSKSDMFWLDAKEKYDDQKVVLLGNFDSDFPFLKSK